MKKIFTTGFVLSIAMLLLLNGCKNDDPEPKTERVRTRLKANTWLVQSVTIDGVDNSNLFTGLSLTFTDTEYTTTNGGIVWPANGTWVFADKSGKLITRSDGLLLTIDEVTNTVLKLSLNWSTTTIGSGRTGSLSGQHQFIFAKN